MSRFKNHTKLSVLLLALSGLVACQSANPEASSEGADYQMTTITPALISQLQHEQFTKYHPAETAPAQPERPYSYELGVGDVLAVKIYVPSISAFSGGMSSQSSAANYRQADNEVMIKDDGTVSLPYAGEVQVGGKTLPEAKKALDSKLEKYFVNPQSVLDVKEFRSHKIQVTGEVKAPGDQYLNFTPLYVLSALKAAGGLEQAADLDHATITHADGTVEPVNLFALMNGGKASQNRILFDGDTLHVPANAGNKVYVMGEVTKPKLQYIEGGHMTIMEALNGADGINQLTASYDRIYVIRGAVDDAMLQKQAVASSGAETPPVSASSFKTHVYQLNGSTGDGLAMAAQFPLQPNDVVYASSSPISDWNKFITLLLPYSVIDAGGLANTWK